MKPAEGGGAVSARTLERIRSFRLMDDMFMQVCFHENIPCTELVLRIIMGRPDLSVRSVTTQKMLKNLRGHSLILDIAATDSEGREYDIEIQRRDDGACPRRTRYHLSLMDATALREGEDFARLPETCVILITEHDVFGLGLPLYSFERRISGGDLRLDDGSRIIYVNGELRDGSTDLAKLMHDFFCTDPDQMYFEPLARTASYFKKDDQGVKTMGSVVEEIRAEGRLGGVYTSVTF